MYICQWTIFKLCFNFLQAGICNAHSDEVENEVILVAFWDDIPNKEEYLHCDDQLQCYGFLTDEEIVGNVCNAPSDTSSCEDTEESHTSTEVITLKDSLSSMDRLQRFYIQNNIDTDPLHEIEETLLKFTIKKSLQSKITDYIF